ncbi:hypothetical protein Tco_0983981 [Tanacetum coccineum]
MFSPDWSIASLLKCIDPNTVYLTPLDDPDVVSDTIFNERPPAKRRPNNGKKIVPDPYQMVLSEMKLDFRKWETILSENVISLSGNKDHPNTCLVYMLYFLANRKLFNLAYYMANRMVCVIKSDLMVLPYGMLLTRLYRHVLTIQPCHVTNAHYLVDHVMVNLIEGRAHRFLIDGKRPHPQTSSSSSSSQSQSQEQEQINLIDNYTLNPIEYCNQLPPIPGGASKEFKQTKGMFKCFGHFLSNLEMKKK